MEHGNYNVFEINEALFEMCIRDSIRAVRDDLAEMPEYAHCETAAYAPEPVKLFRRVRRYRYEMMGIVYPQYAGKNILIDYGVIEEAE